MSISFLNFVGRGIHQSLRGSTAIAVGLFVIAGPAYAQTLFWNNDGVSGDGTPGVAAGDLDSTSLFWNSTSGDTVVNETFPAFPAVLPDIANSATAVFGVAPVTVTIVEPVAPGTLQFDISGYVIAASGTGEINHGANALNIIITDAAVTNEVATISAPIVGAAAGTIAVSGDGRLVLSGNNVNALGVLSAGSAEVDIEGNYGGDINVALGTTLDANTGIIGGVVTNNGGTIEIGGAEFSMGVAVTTGTSSVTVDGNSTVGGAGIVNDGGAVVVELTRILTGNVRNNSGTTTNNGLIDGDLIVAGGLFIAEGGSRVSDTTVTVSDGVLVANGGQFGADGVLDSTITVATGTLSVIAATTVNIENTTGLVGISADVTGDVSQTGSGTTSSAAEIDGEVVVSGGEFVAGAGSSTTDANVVISDTGKLTAASGTFAGAISLTGGALDVTEDTVVDVNTAGGDVTIQDLKTLTGNLSLNDDSTTASFITENFGTVNGQLSIVDGEYIARSGSFTIDDVIAINSGTITADGGEFGTANGPATNNDATFTVTGNGTLAITGDTTATSVINQGGAVSIALGNTLTANLSHASNGTDSPFVTESFGILVGNLSIIDGEFIARFGSSLSDTSLGVSGAEATFTANGGTFAGATTFAVTGEGTLAVTGNASIETVTNQGGTITVADTFNLTADLTSEDNGLGTASDTTITGTLTGELDVRGGLVTVESTGQITDTDVTISGGQLTSTGGDFAGTVSLNDGGTFAVGTAGSSLTTDADVDNDGGTVTIAANQILDGALNSNDLDGLNTGAGMTTNAGTITGNVTLSDGTVQNDGLISGTVTQSATGILTNNSGGAITLLTTATGGTVNADGGAFNGGLVISGATTLTITDDTVAAITNNSTVALNIGDDVITGDFTQGTGTTNNAGDIVGTLGFSGGGTFNNDAGGSISAAATATQGTLNANGGSFDGGLTVSGTTAFDITADTTGDITNGTTGGTPADAGITFEIDNALTVTGNVTTAQANAIINQNGTIDGNLNVNAGSVNASATSDVMGDTNVAAGATLTSSGASFGDVTVTGATGEFAIATTAALTDVTTANVISDNGTVTIAADETLAGNLTLNNADGLSAGTGTTTNAGTITGALGITDGNFTAVTGSDVEGAATASAGTINATGGSFTGGLTVSGTANLLIAADTIADVTNNGVTGLSIPAGQTLTGDFIQAAGTTINDGMITRVPADIIADPTGDVLTVAGGTFTNQTGDVDGTTTISNGTLVAGGGTFGTADPETDITLTGGTLQVTDDTTAEVVNDGGVVNVASNQQLVGSFSSTDDNSVTTIAGQIVGAVTLSDGAITLNTGAGFDDGLGGGNDGFGIAGAVTATSGTLTIQTGTTVRDGVSLTGDAILVAGGDTSISYVNNGTTLDLIAGNTVTGNVTTNDGTTNNAGIINGNVAVNEVLTTPSSIMNNTGTVNADTVTVTGGTLNADAGAMNSDSFTVTGGTLSADGSTFNDKAGTGVATVAVSGTGTLEVDTATTLNATNNGGTVRVDQTLTGTVMNTSGTLENNSTITGVVTNTGTVNANGTFTQTIANNGGQVNVTGNSTGNVTNAGGDLTVNNNQKLTGNLINQNAASQTVVNTGAEIEGTISLSLGSITNNGTLDGNAAVTGGTLTTNGTFEGNVTQSAGTVTNTGTLDGNATVSTGTLNNTNRINGTVGVSANGTFADTGGRVTGVVTQTGGSIIANGTTFDQTVANDGGAMTVSGNTIGDVDSDNGGDLIVNVGGTLTGNVNVLDTNSAMQNDGTVDGNIVILLGSVTTNGIIDGTVQLGATLAPAPAGAIFAPSSVTIGATLNADTGNITGLVTNNGGTVQANGATFDDGIQNNLGDVNINAATTAGNVANAGGTLTITSTLIGDVVNSAGATENNGTLSGTMTIAGGTVEQNSGSNTTGLTTLNGGTLQADGGQFAGGILTTGGTLFITANTTAEIENDGATLTLPATAVITGDFDNTSGTTGVNGTLNGALNIDDGTVTTAGAARIVGVTDLRGGALVADGGVFESNINAFDGALTVQGDTTVAGTIVNRGANITVTSAGELTGNVNQLTGDTTIAGTVTGNVTVADGTVAQTGTISGRTTINGGVFTAETGSVVGGRTTVSAGTLTANGGTFSGITNSGGAIAVAGAVTSDITNTTGSLALNGAAAVLTGNVTNAASLVSMDGTVTGALANTGTVDITGGDLTVGSFINAGTMTVTGGNTLTAATTGQVASDGTLTVTGSTVATGGLTADDGATLNFDRATIVGSLTTATDFTATGGLSISDDLSIGATGRIVMSDGALTVSDMFDLAEGGSIRLETGTSVGAAQTTNKGTITAIGQTAFTGLLANEGTFNMASVTGSAAPAAATFGGLVTNSGTLNGNGVLLFSGGLVNSGTLDLTGNASATDRVSIGGVGLSGNGDLKFDIDLSTENGLTDQITMATGAFITGEVSLSFNLLGDGIVGQTSELVLIDVADGDPGDFTLAPGSIADPRGFLIYDVALNSTGDVVVQDGLNPAFAGVAGNVVLTQSLIGSIVNRPTSPFVAGLAYEDEEPCGAGVWGRVTGGSANSSGTVNQEDGRSDNGTITASYAGVQLGGDYACFNGAINGWDLAVGGIFGINAGSTSQPVFAIDTDTSTGLSTNQVASTSVDFDQIYAGMYVTAVNGPVAVDLQYRVEGTDFSADNSSVGLTNATFSSEATTLSGAVSYFYPIAETDLTFVPTVGFAYTQVSTGGINFDGFGSLAVQDFDSQVGFAGATIAKSSFGDDGVSATRQFLSATIYSDFADDPLSTFTPSDGSGARNLISQNLGTYGELSVGLNYVRILQPNELGSVKQFSASVRADARYSDRLESYGVTGQVRFQF